MVYVTCKVLHFALLKKNTFLKGLVIICCRWGWAEIFFLCLNFFFFFYFFRVLLRTPMLL